MNPVRMVCVLALWMVVSFRALAWNNTGHKLVAAIAYRGLTAEEQASVDEILRHHPSYSAWMRDYASARVSISNGLFVFMEASTWPDDIRDNRDPKTHPSWHYVDYPLRPPGFDFKRAPEPNNDVVFAIAENLTALEEPHVSKRRRAESLSWLIHTVGDIHQPLHCATLYNRTFSGREGDRGGNYFFVKLKPDSANPIKLHTLWDGLAGSGGDADSLARKAGELASARVRASYPAPAFGSNAAAWSKESRTLAVEKVYQPLPSLDGTRDNPVILPVDYFRNSRDLAEKQITLAGYRLADQLRAILAARSVSGTP